MIRSFRIVSPPLLRVFDFGFPVLSETRTEILELTRITKPALYQHLQELQDKGLITKDHEGKYVLTKEGRKHVKELRLMQLLSEVLDILLEEGLHRRVMRPLLVAINVN